MPVRHNDAPDEKINKESFLILDDYINCAILAHPASFWRGWIGSFGWYRDLQIERLALTAQMPNEHI